MECDNNSKIMLNAKLNTEYIYDFTLHQTYSKLSGFLVNMSGLSVIIIAGLRLRSGHLSLNIALILVLIGIFILAYTPLSLFISAKKIVKNEGNRLNINYIFDKNGITREQVYDISPKAANNIDSLGYRPTLSIYRWQDLSKVISTPKTIAYFINDESAYIIPKKNFGNDFLSIMKLTFENMSRDKIYISKIY